METPRVSTCPGCGLRMPISDEACYDGYYNASPECWSVNTEVLGADYSNALLFGQVHQLTVDTYAVQHAGGEHPNKSVGIHLCGLHLLIEMGRLPTSVPPLLQRLAVAVKAWPHFPPPDTTGSLTVFDVALADSVEEHIDITREWARTVWGAWSQHHRDVASLVSAHLELG